MKPIFILCDHPHGADFYKAGTVVEVDDAMARALLAAGVADDHPNALRAAGYQPKQAEAAAVAPAKPKRTKPQE